jgi:ATP-dependent Clp protease protease subunit
MRKYINHSPIPTEEPKELVMSGLRFQFRNEADEAIIDIDGAIGFDWMKWIDDQEQNDAETIKRKLRGITANKIIVNINSLGGDVNDGIVIHDLLKESPAHVITDVKGMTASAGTIISLAGNERRMSANAKYLAHVVSGFLFGWFNQFDLSPVFDDLDSLSDLVADMYVKAGTKSKKEYKDLMAEFNGRGRFLSAEQAKEWGFIDTVYEPGADEVEKANKVEQRNLNTMINSIQALRNREVEALASFLTTNQK